MVNIIQFSVESSNVALFCQKRIWGFIGNSQYQLFPSLAFIDFTMVCVKIRFSNKSYFMKINSLTSIANHLFDFFMIRGCTEMKFWAAFICLYTFNILTFDILSLRLSITFIQERAIDFSTEIFTGKREMHNFGN